MHHLQKAQITAEFLVEGSGPAVLQRTWPDGADFATSSVYVQFRGEKRADLEQLEWSAALTGHRPFLAHGEIEAFFGSPSRLNELLASVLGLEDLNAGAARLRQARLSRESAFKEVSKSLRDLLIRLEGTADERAGTCLAALSGRTPDLAAARQAAAGARAGMAGVSSAGSADSHSSPSRPRMRSGTRRRCCGKPPPGWRPSPDRPRAGRGRSPCC
jgi:hypothetical protein